jgi:two-component system CheB/CheR fusion protein
MANANHRNAPQDPSAPAANALNVLVVEDDPDAAESLRHLLVLYGHRAAVARDGPAAVALAAQFRPDVVFLDLGLPGGMDGLEVARRIGVRPDDGKAPLLVAVTGRDREDDRRRSELAGIHLHMVKPADPEVLRDLLARFKDVVG